MKKNFIKIFCSLFMLFMGIAMFVLKQIPFVDIVVEQMGNMTWNPTYGIIHKIGWNNFSTISILMCLAFSAYFAFFFKEEKEVKEDRNKETNIEV